MAKTQTASWRDRRLSSNKRTSTASRKTIPLQNDFIDFSNYREAIAPPAAPVHTIGSNEQRSSVSLNPASSTGSSKKLNHYQIGKPLGKGSYAVVHHAVDTRDNIAYALKTYERAKLHNKTRKTIVEREIQVLTFLNSSYTVRLFKTIHTKNHVIRAFLPLDTSCYGACRG